MKNRMLTAATTLAAVAALALPALAAASTEGPDPQLQQLHIQIAAARLDKLLDLSRDQARALVPILQQAQGLQAQLRAEREKLKPQVASALTQIREDVQSSGAASPASVQALKAARSDAQTQALRDQMKALHAQAKALLTQDQLARLHQFDPRPVAMDAQGAGGEAGMHRGKGHGRMGRFIMAKVALSPEFGSLLQARAQ